MEQKKINREGRYQSLLQEFVVVGGFSEQQAAYLIGLLSDFIPLV